MVHPATIQLAISRHNVTVLPFCFIRHPTPRDASTENFINKSTNIASSSHELSVKACFISAHSSQLAPSKRALADHSFIAMAVVMSTHELTVFCGMLGIFVSFLMYLSPLFTYVIIHIRRSTEDYLSLPHAVALFSAMLYLYYAMLKPENGILQMSINTVGMFIESFYMFIHLKYAPPASRIRTSRIFFIFNLGVYALVILITCAFKGKSQEKAAGWACAIFSVIVFPASFSKLHRVIVTKNVNYIPWTLSVMQTLSAVFWFFYGFLIHDYFVAFPNILGFILSITQIVLYAYYRKSPVQNAEQEISSGALSVINEEQFEDVRPVNSTEDQLNNEAGHYVVVENAIYRGNEIHEIQLIIFKVVEIVRQRSDLLVN